MARLLINAKADVNAARTTNGWTPLITASEHGHLDVVRTLLHAAADVNSTCVYQTDLSDGDTAVVVTALHLARLGGHVEVVKELLAADGMVVPLGLRICHCCGVTGRPGQTGPGAPDGVQLFRCNGCLEADMPATTIPHYCSFACQQAMVRHRFHLFLEFRCHSYLNPKFPK